MSGEAFRRLPRELIAPQFWLKLYFIALPFIFLIQALLMNKLVAAIPSIFLLIAVTMVLIEKKEYILQWRSIFKTFNNLDWMIVGFFIITLFWVIIEYFTAGIVFFVSALMRYLITLFVYALVSRSCTRENIVMIMFIISFTSLIVSLELIHENINTRLFQKYTFIQSKNYDYVKELGVGEARPQYTSLKGRPIGILEHNHATSLYICMGFIASIVLFFLKERPFLLFIAAFDLITLFISGVRLVLLFVLIAFIVMMFYLRKDDFIRARYRIVMVLMFLCTVVLISGLIGFWDFIKDVAVRTYLNPITKGDFGQGDEVILDSFWNVGVLRFIDSFAKHPITIPFGAGYPPLLSHYSLTSEDFFFLQVFGQYGLIGGLLFYLFLFFSLGNSVCYLRVGRGEDRLLVLFAGILIGIFILTTLHSPVIQRKAIYPYLFFVLGIIRFVSISAKQDVKTSN